MRSCSSVLLPRQCLSENEMDRARQQPIAFIRKPNVIVLANDRFNWQASREVLKKIHRLVVVEAHPDVVLDLSVVKRIYPNGIVPVIAQIDRLRAQGLVFRIIPPADHDLSTLCDRLGWLHYLDPAAFPKGTDAIASTALHKFQSDEDLNSLVNRAVEICLQQLLFAQGVPAAFEWTLNEIAGNVLVHAEAPGFIQVITYRESGTLVFIVCDSGLGIPATIRRSFQNIGNDIAALEYAIRAGVTSKPSYGQGNGLAGSIAIAKTSGGAFSVTSGRARLKILNENLQATDHYPPYEGTCVEMQLPVNKPIDLPKALWGHEPIPYTELKFSDEKGDQVFKLREYASSFGNRITGEKIRNLVRNLLIQHPGHRVKIVMEGIMVISSSFADELFGKLALELGVVDFGRLLAFDQINPVCKSLVDTAIQQRLAQGLGAKWPNDDRDDES
jgi:hypothetical protein